MTIFSRIIAREIPCHRVYEDEHVLAFLDINPLSRGHTLVIPKRPVERLDELPDDEAAALGRAVARIAAAVVEATGTRDYNVFLANGAPAGQEVMHAHFHVIPQTGDSGIEMDLLRRAWRAGTLPDDVDELRDAIASRCRR